MKTENQPGGGGKIAKSESATKNDGNDPPSLTETFALCKSCMSPMGIFNGMLGILLLASGSSVGYAGIAVLLADMARQIYRNHQKLSKSPHDPKL